MLADMLGSTSQPPSLSPARSLTVSSCHPFDLSTPKPFHFARPQFLTLSSCSSRPLNLQAPSAPPPSPCTTPPPPLRQGVDIFRSVSSTDNSEMWAAILPLRRPIKFEYDEILCEQGEDTQDMMIVIEGKVKCIAKLEDSEMAVLSQHRSQEVPNTGRETRILSTGDCINDVNMLRIWDHAVESAR